MKENNIDKILYDYEAKGINPSEEEKAFLIEKLKRINDKVMFYQNLIMRIQLILIKKK